MARPMRRPYRHIFLAVGLVALAGCEDFSLLEGAGSGPEAEGFAPVGASAAQSRDVEAPEVFQAQENGLWDGRPSLGGVWVAHPDVTDPERVLIRNMSNGSTVVGALFRRERESPGPQIQVSSDAAVELGMLSGQPTELAVVALRKETVEQPRPEEAAPEPDAAAPVAATVESLPEPQAVETEALDSDPLAAAAAAIDAADEAPAIRPAATEEAPLVETAPAEPAATAAPPAAPAAIEKPFIQIGIFSVEDNAASTADTLRQAGIIPTVLRQESQGEVFWRVLVGPAASTVDRDEVLSQVKGLGFTDAYSVTN
ncbi:MAG: SPOR domain-containing protein [Pseudomonadota bacterium]